MRKESPRNGSLRLAALALLVLAAGCDYAARVSDQVAGSGNRRTERREIGEFDELVVDGAYRVEVTCGQPPSVEVEADDNVLPLIKLTKTGGRVVITQERGFKVGSLPRIRLSVPDLKSVRIDGASDFELSGVANDRLSVDVDGAGRLRASGRTEALDVKLNGAARIDAGGLEARAVNVESNGAGLTTVRATETLDATINGVGGVEYYGEPKVVNPKINGLGRINKK